jgi:hypothetical protein
MSPTFTHSSKSVYLFPISHSNNIHNFFNYNINLQLVVNVPDLVWEMVEVDTGIDLFITVLDLLVEE